jgi:hypothetical protein
MKVVKGYKQSLKHEVKNNFKKVKKLEKSIWPSLYCSEVL